MTLRKVVPPTDYRTYANRLRLRSFFQTAKIVRGKTIQGGGRLPDETAALHSESSLDGYSGGPVDRDATAQPHLAGGALFSAGGAECQRHEDLANRASPLEDSASDIDQSGPCSTADLVQTSRILE